jgi:hypothetical protein
MHALETAWEALRRDFDSACLHAGDSARLRLTADLNQIFRRLRHYENEDQWISAVRDAVSKFAGEFGIFTQKDDVSLLRAQEGLGVPDGLEIKSVSARAFATALESRDPLVALRSSGEVGVALSREPSSLRAHLFPITNSGRAVALIFAADNDSLDGNALELIAVMASTVLERRSNQAIHSQIAPAAVHPVPEANRNSEEMRPTRSALPPWSNLSEDHRLLHVRAQRFCRAAVAHMELNRPECCRAGREQNNLYMFLQPEIDKARENYRKQFMTIPSMVDYLHLELISTAAGGDEHKLGADYPGRLL